MEHQKSGKFPFFRCPFRDALHDNERHNGKGKAENPAHNENFQQTVRIGEYKGNHVEQPHVVENTIEQDVFRI